MRIPRREAGGDVGDVASDAVHFVAREATRSFRSIAEERAAPERARLVDAATAFRIEQRDIDLASSSRRGSA